MARLFVAVTLLITVLAFMCVFVVSQLVPAEQESVYRILESIGRDVQWRTLFPDDLCASSPHGVVCEYFSDGETAHVTELSFGYVSDYSPNPPCDASSTLDPSLLLPLTRLKKLFFYRCFTERKTAFPDFSLFSSRNTSSSLEEVVFVENPALFGSLDGKIGGLRRLRRLVLTGSNVSGRFPDAFGDLINLQQLTLSRNNFTGEIHTNIFQNMKKLKILDLSSNGFEGHMPESVGDLTNLLKLDLSFNGFSGKIPENLRRLKNLEFMDLSYNRFGSFGLPLFLSEMPSLKELFLSGNALGGQIPEMWSGLRGIMGIGLSCVGLIGNIPKSMGSYLKNTTYLGLDNNNLEGVLPAELGGLEAVRELNLENNKLQGRVPFSPAFVSRLGKKLRLEGNSDLCVDEAFLKSAKVSVGVGQLKVCGQQPWIPRNAISCDDSSSSSSSRTRSGSLGFMPVLILYGVLRTSLYW